MFKLWLFWAFLRIQLLRLLRTMTTFTSGQASRPDLAPLALLPGQLKNCLGIYLGVMTPLQLLRPWAFPPPKCSMHLPCALQMLRHQGARPGWALSCKEKLFARRWRFPSAVYFALEQKVWCHVACASPGICLGLPVLRSSYRKQGEEKFRKNRRNKFRSSSTELFSLFGGLGVFLFASWLGGRVINLWVNTASVWN